MSLVQLRLIGDRHGTGIETILAGYTRGYTTDFISSKQRNYHTHAYDGRVFDFSHPFTIRQYNTCLLIKHALTAHL